MPGTSTLAVEVTHVSKHGFWLLLGDEKLLLPFTECPSFKDAVDPEDKKNASAQLGLSS